MHRTAVPVTLSKSGLFGCKWMQPKWFWTKQKGKWLDVVTETFGFQERQKLTWMMASLALPTLKMTCSPCIGLVLTCRSSVFPWGVWRRGLGDLGCGCLSSGPGVGTEDEPIGQVLQGRWCCLQEKSRKEPWGTRSGNVPRDSNPRGPEASPPDRGIGFLWGPREAEKGSWADALRVVRLCVFNKRSYIYMWNLKKWYKWTYLQNINRVTDVENKLMVTKGERGGEGQLGRLGLTYTHYYL